MPTETCAKNLLIRELENLQPLHGRTHTIITTILIKRGVQVFLHAEQLNVSQLNNRKAVFKIKRRELD